MKRQIIEIDEAKCNGCGQCASACHEGAIQMVNGKAKLVSDSYCDGLGACLGECPVGAIQIIEREAAAFDETAVAKHLAKPAPAPASACGCGGDAPAKPAPGQEHEHGHGGGGCPGARAMSFAAPAAAPAAGGVGSQLRQWPVQLHLVPTTAPYWQDADLLICADCVPVAYGDFQKLLAGRRLVIACPKLDDSSGYVEKLARILRENSIRRITVAHMEVPCCMGLLRLAQLALVSSGKDLPLDVIEIGIQGQARLG